MNDTSSKHLKNCADEPVEQPITEQKQVALECDNFNTRWDKLTGAVNDSTDQVKEVKSELDKVNEKKALLDQLLDEEVEKELDEQKPVNVNPAKCDSNLDKIKVCFKILPLLNFFYSHLSLRTIFLRDRIGVVSSLG